MPVGITRKDKKIVSKGMKGQSVTRGRTMSPDDISFTKKENMLKRLAKRKFWRKLNEEQQQRYDNLVKQLRAKEVIYDPYNKIWKVVY